MFYSDGYEVIDRSECLYLLSTTRIGRIVFTERAMPAIEPVAFAVHADAIVFMTGAGSPLAAATAGAVVGFEADCISPSLETGWSVRAVGVADLVTEDDEDLAVNLDLRSWSKQETQQCLRIVPTNIDGRRIVAHVNSPAEQSVN